MEPDLRAVLHDETGRRGHGSRPVRDAGRRAAARRQDRGRRIAPVGRKVGRAIHRVAADQERKSVSLEERHRDPRRSDRSRAPAIDNGPAPRVLIIDDEASIRAALRRFFTRRGWRVDEAEDGAKGLADAPGGEDDFTVVISDLRMPDCSGVELHDHIAAVAPELLDRIIFSTGDVARGEAAEFVQTDAVHRLQKPFELRALDALVSRIRKDPRLDSTRPRTVWFLSYVVVMIASSDIPAFVNPLAGNADAARAALSAVGGFDIREVPPQTLAEHVAAAIGEGATRVLVAGGDGSIGSAADALVRNRTSSWRFFRPEHSITSRRILRCRSISKTAARVAQDGHAVAVDAAVVNDRIFLNTSSVGAYVTFVRARERLEKYLGYHIASFVAGDALAHPPADVSRHAPSRGRGARVHHAAGLRRGRRARAQAPDRSALASRTGRRDFTSWSCGERSGARAFGLALAAAARGVEAVARTPALDSFFVDECKIEPRTHMAAVDGEIVQRIAAARSTDTCPAAFRSSFPAQSPENRRPTTTGNAHGVAFGCDDSRPSDSRRSRNRSDARRPTRRDRRRAARAVPAERAADVHVGRRCRRITSSPGSPSFPARATRSIAVVRELAARRLPFVPRGAGTGLSGGALADGVVLIGLNRLYARSLGRRGELARGRRAGRRERRADRAPSRAHGSALRSRSVEPGGVHDRRQRRRERRRSALPQVRRHDESHRRAHRAAPERRSREARHAPRANTTATISSARSSDRKDASASRSTSRCVCREIPKRFARCSPISCRSTRRRARCRRSWRRESFPPRSR